MQVVHLSGCHVSPSLYACPSKVQPGGAAKIQSVIFSNISLESRFRTCYSRLRLNWFRGCSRSGGGCCRRRPLRGRWCCHRWTRRRPRRLTRRGSSWRLARWRRDKGFLFSLYDVVLLTWGRRWCGSCWRFSRPLGWCRRLRIIRSRSPWNRCILNELHFIPLQKKKNYHTVIQHFNFLFDHFEFKLNGNYFEEVSFIHRFYLCRQIYFP